MNTNELSQIIQRNSGLFSDVMSGCHTLLKHSPSAKEVRDYLNTRVNLNSKEFTFGYFPDDEHLHELTNLISFDVLKELELAYTRKISDVDVVANINCSIFNRHNLVMLYKNLSGDNIALVGRTLLNKEEQKEFKVSKYKNSSCEKKLHLFGLNKAKKYILEKDYVIIVEGQFDFISCYMRGIKNVVALGSASLSKYQFNLLRRYTNRIKLMLDNDEAGKKATNIIMNRWSDKCNMKDGAIGLYKDVDEYLKDGLGDYSVFDF